MICIEKFHGRPCMYPTRVCENKKPVEVDDGEEHVLPK